MSAFAMPATRPVRRNEVTLVYAGETGEIVGWKGLNSDPDRCPAEVCGGNCPRHCQCAPCRCPECLAREAIARGEDEFDGPRRVAA